MQVSLRLLVVAASLLLAGFSLPQGDPAEQQTKTGSRQDFVADGVMRQSSQPGMREAYLPVLFPSSHAANLLVLRNGTLLCSWFSGTWEGDSDVSIVVSRLPKGTNQWTKAVVVDHQPGKSFQNPVSFQDATGKILLFHTAQTANKGQADAQVFMVTSSDDGDSWGSRELLFSKAGSYIRQPLLAMSTTEWLLPMYYTPSEGITKGADANYSAVKITKDGGKTWSECEIPKSEGLVQPTVVRLDNGNFLALFRSRYADWIYQSASKDGCVWSAPSPTQIPNNNSSIQMTKLEDGHLVLVFNNSNASTSREKPQTAPRKPLSAALSVDGGKTWPWVRDIEAGSMETTNHDHFPEHSGREEYSYPAVVQASDGHIYVAYTYRRLDMKVVSFDEDWIKQGATAGKFSGDSQK